MSGPIYICNRPFCKAFSAAAFWIVVGAHAALPARMYWTSPEGGDTRWSNEANWSATRVPRPGDTVVLGVKGKSLAPCDLDADASVADIFFRTAYAQRFDFGSHVLSVTGDTCDLRSGGEIGDGNGRGGILFEPAGILAFFPGSQAVLPNITVRCMPGGAVVCRESGFRADTLSFQAGTFRCGSNLAHQAGVVQSSGGGLSLDSSALAVSGAMVNFAGLASLLSANGTLVFRGAAPQRIVFPPDSVRIHCLIQDGGGGTVISKIPGTVLYADTTAIRSGIMMLDDSASLTLGAFQSVHGGLVIPASARFTLRGNADFSGLDSLAAAGPVVCAGLQSWVTLTPKIGAQVSRLEVTSGRLQLAGNGLWADSVRCAAACTLSLGTRLVHVVRAFSLEQGAVVNFESSVLRFAGARLDLSGCGGILPGTGCIEFNGASPQVFAPAAGKMCPSVFQNGPGGTTLSGCDLLAGSLAIGAGTFNLNGYSASVDTLRGSPAGDNDSLKIGSSPPSVINARGSVFLDQMAVSGDIRLQLSGAKQDLRVPGNCHIVKLTQSGSSRAAVSAPAGARLTIDTLCIRSGTLDLGGSSGSFVANVQSLSAAGGGISFGGSIMRFSGDTLDLSRCAVPSQQTDGGIEFCGAKQQVFMPASAAVYPALVASGPGPTTVTGAGFSCARLSVASGGTLLLGTALTHSVSSRIQIVGAIDFGTSTLSVAADSVDLSAAVSLVPGNGTLSFAGANGTQVFVPKAGALHPNIIKTRAGTVVLGGPCAAKKLWIADGTFDCGNYKCELTGFSAIGGSLAVGSDSLIVSGNALFAGLTAVSAASAPIVVRTSPASPVSVFSTGDREIGNLVLLAAGAGGPARIIAAPGTHRVSQCTFVWNRSQDSAVFDFRQNNASLSVSDSAGVLIRGTGVDKGRIYMGNGTWTFAGSFALADYARDGSKIVFTTDTGIQTLTAPLLLGDVVHSGAGRLQLLSNVKCRSFTQTAGVLDFNGCAVSSEGDVSVANGSDSSIAPSTFGWKMETLGSASLSGGIRNYLSIASAAQCTLSAAVSLRARYAVLKNCRALLQKGTASKCVDSLGNSNWFFSNRPAPPSGLYARRGNGAVSLLWNRSPAADAVRYFAYAGTSAATLSKRDSTDSPQDTVRTIANLTNGQPYFFSVTVLDSAGSESDFSGQVSAIPDSGLLAISAGRVSFGRVTVGTVDDTAISLYNGCTDTVVIASVKASSAAFACSLTSWRIPPRQSVSDTLTFRPLRQGPDSAAIVILSNALSSPDTIRVSGAGTAPRFCAVPDSALFDVPGPAAAAFIRTIVVRNAGNDTLRISQITRLVTDDYGSDSLFTLSQIRDLAPGDSCFDTVRFTPGKAGNFSAKFLVKSNCTTPFDTIFVVGKCGAAAVQPALAAVPKDFSFQEASVAGRMVVFRYALPVATRVTLDIYNAIGRFLERPLESSQSPREYQFSWDGSHVSRGIYFCRFKAADSDDADPKFMKTIRIVFSK